MYHCNDGCWTDGRVQNQSRTWDSSLIHTLLVNTGTSHIQTYKCSCKRVALVVLHSSSNVHRYTDSTLVEHFMQIITQVYSWTTGAQIVCSLNVRCEYLNAWLERGRLHLLTVFCNHLVFHITCNPTSPNGYQAPVPPITKDSQRPSDRPSAKSKPLLSAWIRGLAMELQLWN